MKKITITMWSIGTKLEIQKALKAMAHKVANLSDKQIAKGGELEGTNIRLEYEEDDESTHNRTGD